MVVADPNRTAVGDVKAKDYIVDKFIKGKDCKDVAEISVNYTDNDGNVKQEKISKEGHVTGEKTTQRSARSIYKQAQRIKETCGSRSDKFLSIDTDSYDRIFPNSAGTCQKGKYIVNSEGKLELVVRLSI